MLITRVKIILKKLYLQGQLSDVVEKAKALTMKYPNSIFVWNILGASQKGLGKSYDALKAFKFEILWL